ncbi:MAG: CPXCG motif-containing cysteine-rich protein [Psychroflexus sp.]|nr:CPXCG motif-containing cysteine-rich protein [Psychroflexus sp.]MDN6310948.1 CPXCG motif-containing cysteine-rich protein [Psychroflexus sp.]
MIEHFFQCPYCWQNISMLLDSTTDQTYIEDCEVCCQPIQITTKFNLSQLIDFRAVRVEQ